ncbi:MAG: GDYXXLXY domain-containing protein [Clostridia bacterium]|nr:GDYXXLXY domain-containing protein [Clostridia bacterium]
MKKFKLETSVIFLIIPFLIVIGMLIYNLIINATGEEMYFKMTGYDPYDSLRGRYLSLSFDFDELAVPEACGYIYIHNEEDKKLFQTPINSKIEIDEIKNKDEFNYYQSDQKFLMILESLDSNKKDKVYDTLQYFVDLISENEETKNDLLKRSYYESDSLANSIFEQLINIDMRFNLISDDNGDYDYQITRTFLRLLCALDNSNMTVKEFFDQIEIKYYGEKDSYLSDYVYYYLIFEKDENNIAQVKDVTLNKKEAKESNLPYVKVRTYRRYLALDSLRLSDDEKEYYIDERIADYADMAINYATANGKIIYVKSKVKYNGIQFEEVYIDDILLEDYVEEYKKNISDEEKDN